jgi:SPP1 gp7 family putative phage head morphogenesis protein
MLDRSVDILRAGLRKGAAAWLDDFARHYSRTGRVDGSGATVGDYLADALEQAWLTAWAATGRDLSALVRDRFRVRAVAVHDAQPAPPQYTQPSPLPLPADFRTWLETHTPAEGGTGPVPVSRSIGEWLAEHEASVNRWVPREYVDRYLRSRLPPLVGIADRNLLERARDLVAANVERGFGVRETVLTLHRQFSDFSAARLENIARTEGAVCYEHGHLARYLADGLVEGVEFSAIEDDRTTETCKWHDKRCYKLGSEVPTPPMHYQCRSTLLPILFNETPQWTTEQPPDDAQPLNGFGTVSPGLLPPNVTSEQLFSGAEQTAFQLPAEIPMPAFKPAAAVTRRTQDAIRRGERKWDERPSWRDKQAAARAKAAQPKASQPKVPHPSRTRPAKVNGSPVAQADGTAIPIDKLKRARNGHSLDWVARRADLLDDPWVRSLTTEEREAVWKWTRYKFQRPMMRYIETGEGTAEIARDAEAMLRAMAKAPRHVGNIYRGLADVSDANLDYYRQLAQQRGSIDFASVRSSSKLEAEAAKFAARTQRGGNAVVLEIRQRSAVDISELSSFAWQRETLVPKGMNCRIIDVVEERTRGGRTWFRVMVEEL